MTRLSAPARLAGAGFAWLSLFALIFTIGGAVGLEPAVPAAAFAATDLVAGLSFGVVLLATLAARRPRPLPSAAPRPLG
jgi:hypothetical protein